MKQKTLTIIFGMILLIGIVSAATFTGVSEQITIPPFIAGDTTSTTFSFDYENDGFNNPDASLILKVNIESLEQQCPLPLGDCSVWKGDFQLSGLIEQYSLFDLFLGKIFPLTCVEDNAEFRVQRGLLYTETNIPPGTFYCYDPSNYIDMLELDRRDKVTLDITSHPALYPGNYSVSIDFMEMEPDNQGPVIELIAPLDGSAFSGVGTIPIKLSITDMYNIDPASVRYKIVNFFLPAEGEGLFPEQLDDISYDSGWIYDIEYNTDSGLYEAEFDIANSDLINSGLYWIYAEAKDILGNEGKL